MSAAARLRAIAEAATELTRLIWKMALLAGMIGFVMALVLLVMVGAGNPWAEQVWQRITVGTVRAEAESREARGAVVRGTEDAAKVRKNVAGSGDTR